MLLARAKATRGAAAQLREQGRAAASAAAAQANGLAYAEALRLCRPAAAAIEVADDDISLRCKGCSAEFAFTVAHGSSQRRGGRSRGVHRVQGGAARRHGGRRTRAAGENTARGE